MTIRTRFAPSPTGYMHIGGMRTALFNWLWARHNGGQFILRIDDTDQQRNIEAALAPILQAFRWLGLDWDEGPEVGGPHEPYYQSQRGDVYRQAIDQLLQAGKAHRDFDPPEVVKADREAAEKEKRNYLNIRRSLELSEAERQAKVDASTPFVIRLLVDRDIKVSIEDQIRGHVEWDCGLIPDPVIARSDGSPLYNFATVVDDIQLEITDVIRAEEHLTNTAVQVLIYQALGAQTPKFAHLPFVAAPGTTEKLSKRKIGKYRTNPQFRKLFDMADAVLPRIGLEVSEALNPVMVEYYERMGFLPEAILNALGRLGWSFDDKTEFMSREFLIEHFSLDRVVKGCAGFDPDKLLAYQEHWMGQLTLDQKVDGCLPYLVRAGWVKDEPDAATRDFVSRLITALGDRLKLFSDILLYDEYFVADDALAFDEKAFEKRITKAEDAVALLQAFAGELGSADNFTAASLHDLMQRFVDSRGIKLGDIIHAVRVAVSGKAVGPGMFECLELLGRERCLKRIELAISRASGQT